MTKKIMFFTAPWCQSCKTLKPHLEKLKDRIEIEYVDVDAYPQAAEEYGITNLPTLFFVQDGELKKHRTGSSAAIIKEIYFFVEE